MIAVGLLSGWHAANWGAYKDVPYEGFRWASYVRSVLVGGVVATVIATVVPADELPPLLVLLGVFYALERLGTELWKSILREDDQSSYTIPMRLGFRSRTIDRRLKRYVAGAAVVLALLTLCLAGDTLQRSGSPAPLLVTVLVGGAGGWITAVGGAWKDAPVEGFSGWKFLRSPAVATAWAIPLSAMTTHWVALAFSAAGFAVSSIETYKTFLTRGRPPGKFADKQIRHSWPRARARFAFLHAALWSALALTTAYSISLGQWRGASALAAAVIASVAGVAAMSVVAAVPWRSLWLAGPEANPPTVAVPHSHSPHRASSEGDRQGLS